MERYFKMYKIETLEELSDFETCNASKVMNKKEYKTVNSALYFCNNHNIKSYTDNGEIQAIINKVLKKYTLNSL